jgi:hypothetical protein
MPKLRSIQTNFTAGVIAPLAAAREDVAFYYNGLEDGYNVLNIPQGGVRRRPGNKHVAELAPVMTAISYSGATATAPEGGTAGNAIDGDEATLLTTVNNLSTTNPFVIFHVDFAAAKNVLAADVINYSLSAGSLDGEFRLQYSTDNSAWNNFGSAFDADATSRSRRQRSDTAVSARYWRFARIGATSLASTVSVAEIKFWESAATLSASRLVPFNHPTAEAYMMLATDGNIDVFVGDERTGAIAIGHTAAQLPVLNWTQQRDTLLLFHSALAPFKIFRQGADDEFDFRKVVFKNIPKFDYGAGTGGVDEIQRINISQALDGSHKFTILLDGERTTVINGDATPATVATSIQTALRNLDNTSATGITVASVTDGYDVTFGGDDGDQPWGLMSVSILAGNAVVDVARTTKGELPGEDIMSDARGWPRCGCLYQTRLHMGGIPGVGDAALSSTLTDYFDFDIEIEDATKALLTRSEAGDAGTIYQIVAGRHLTLFTNEAELYFPTEPISDESVPKLTTRTGSKEGIPVYEEDGALHFIQGVKDDEEEREIGTSLREYLFVDTEQSYTAENLSKLSAHLIKNPVDQAKRPAISTDDASIKLIVNEDGSLTAQTMLRSDIVNALIPQSTPNGLFKASRVDKRRRVYFVVERVINGVTRRFLERWDDDLLLDGGDRETMTYEEFTATEGQDEFIWTFTNPASAAAIGVRLDGGRLDPADYSVNLGTKTVTLNEGVAAGTVVRVASMVNEITGLDHLAGETVQTYIDGTAGDDVTVTVDGTLTLPVYADTEIQYGYDFGTYGKLMPFRVPGQETLAGEKIRVSRAVLSLYQTGSIEIRANLNQWRAISLLKTDDDVLDRSTKETLFTGEIDVVGLMGCEVGGYLEWRQTSPDPLTIRSITREARF